MTSAAGLHGLMHAALSTVAARHRGCRSPGRASRPALLVGVAQVGFRPSAHALKLDFKRLNPASGLRNLFGPNLVFETVKAVVKIAVVGAAVALSLILPGLTTLAADVGMSRRCTVGALLGGRAMRNRRARRLRYLVIGVIDYAWQRRRHEEQLKMTKQEVKDETAQHGLPARFKRPIRRRQMQIARARMMAAVPSADVVVTNPTHFAVALGYDGTRTAPEVVAKGQDLVAAQIRRIAKENEVPIVADPPLARALHCLHRDRPDDPRRALRSRRAGAGVRLQAGRPQEVAA